MMCDENKAPDPPHPQGAVPVFVAQPLQPKKTRSIQHRRTCPICKKTYASRQSLYMHRKNCTPREPQSPNDSAPEDTAPDPEMRALGTEDTGHMSDNVILHIVNHSTFFELFNTLLHELYANKNNVIRKPSRGTDLVKVVDYDATSSKIWKDVLLTTAAGRVFRVISGKLRVIMDNVISGKYDNDVPILPMVTAVEVIKMLDELDNLRYADVNSTIKSRYNSVVGSLATYMKHAIHA
eukprot:2308701-Pleurochrysis_carterae.AAC.2